MALSFLLVSSAALAQEESDKATETDDDTQSGYDELQQFGGPEGVSQTLKRDDEKKDSTFQFDGLQRGLKPWFDWKRRIQEENGVALGVQFYALYQDASSSLDGRDDDAFGNIFRFFGKWTVYQHENGNTGRIEWRVESRSNFGSFPGAGLARFSDRHRYSRARLCLLR